ncbi:MAG TPA: DUF222 domain-containing protein, partial [Steroidobacteraceae bacterium]|nr:DUF222 domain-containing protein [Steroidobacteraceae bacterium]
MRGYRRSLEVEELSREARQQANRSVQFHYDDDGSLVLKARLPAEVGAIVLKAFEAALESQRQEEVTAVTSDDHDRETVSARRADALGVLAESSLAHGAASLNGGERQQIIVHVDAETLIDARAGRCEFDEGPSVSAVTSRRLACDASVEALQPRAALSLPPSARARRRRRNRAPRRWCIP